MFWDSVVAGLNVFTYWEIYVLGLIYIAIFYLPLAVVGILIEKSESFKAASGCIYMILMSVLEVTAMIIVILTISPIVFGLSEDAAWSFPWLLISKEPAIFFKLVGVVIVTEVVLAILPIIGKLEALQTLISGGIALVFVLISLDLIIPSLDIEHVNFIPGFWFSIGLVVIGGIMSWVGITVGAAIVIGIDWAIGKNWPEDVLGLVLVPITAIFGFIPVFMYGAWLGAQISVGM